MSGWISDEWGHFQQWLIDNKVLEGQPAAGPGKPTLRPEPGQTQGEQALGSALGKPGLSLTPSVPGAGAQPARHPAPVPVPSPGSPTSPGVPAGTPPGTEPDPNLNMSYPFDRQYASTATTTDTGVSYAMPQGQDIVTPFAGVVTVKGNQVWVTTANGWTFSVKGVQTASVKDGQDASAGWVLGKSGSNVEVQWVDPSGNYTDPSAMMGALQAGAKPADLVKYEAPHGWTKPGGGPIQQRPQDPSTLPLPTPTRYLTPDGHVITSGTPEDARYQTLDNIWSQVYGTGVHAPYSAIQALEATGLTDPTQLKTVIQEWPGPHGLTIGTYQGMMNTGQKLADKYWGIPIPDALIGEWAGQGIKDPEAINLWFLNHSLNDVPKDDLSAIHSAASKFTQSVWGTAPHPDQITAIHTAMTS